MKIFLLSIFYLIFNFLSCQILEMADALSGKDKKGKCTIHTSRFPYKMDFENKTKEECDKLFTTVNLVVLVDNISREQASSTIKFNGSCYYTGLDYCNDYYLTGYSLNACSEGAVINRTDNCSTRYKNNIVGYCKLDSGSASNITYSSANYIVRVYYSPTYNKDSASSHCINSFGGKFSETAY